MQVSSILGQTSKDDYEIPVLRYSSRLLKVIHGQIEEFIAIFSSAEASLSRLPVDDVPDGFEVLCLFVLVLETEW